MKKLKSRRFAALKSDFMHAKSGTGIAFVLLKIFFTLETEFSVVFFKSFVPRIILICQKEEVN